MYLGDYDAYYIYMTFYDPYLDIVDILVKELCISVQRNAFLSVWTLIPDWSEDQLPLEEFPSSRPSRGPQLFCMAEVNSRTTPLKPIRT